MTIPTLTTERLLLKPLVAEDAAQIQKLYPRWEIVRYMVSSVPLALPGQRRRELCQQRGAAGYGKRDRLVLEHPPSRGAG